MDSLSLKDLYVSYCKQNRCKPNSLVLKLLQTDNGSYEFTELDLSRNFVGPKGVLPVLEVARKCKNLKRLSVKDNYLDNQAVHSITTMAIEHPTLSHLDLSNNPISWTAAMSILEMINANPRISYVNLEGTFIKPEIIDTVNKKCTYRRPSGMAPVRRQSLSASNVGRLRSLKGLFQQIVSREGQDGKVHKKNVIAGYKEARRLMGEMDVRRPTEFWVELQKRCNPDNRGMIGWEEFLVTSMCNDVSVHAGDVERLRTEFKDWDKNNNGLIELSELKNMMTQINGKVPNNQEVLDKMTQFGNAEQGATIDWDQFLVMMYEWLQGAPAVGSYGRAPSTNVSAPKKGVRLI